MKNKITSTIFSKIVFYLLVYIIQYFPCLNSSISLSGSKSIKIEDLIGNETLSLSSSELSDIYTNYQSIDNQEYEIIIKKLNDEVLQNKDMVNSNIYISKKCLDSLEDNIKLEKNTGYIYIVTNKKKSNKNGIKDYYFIIRYIGEESKTKFINGSSFDFSFCSSDPIILKKSIHINEIKRYKLSETNEYILTDIDINQVLYAKSKNIDLFNINSNFFNDICYKFNSVNNTDVTLETRNNDYYQNVTLCDINLGAVYINFEYNNFSSIFTYKCAYGYFKSNDESKNLMDEINNKMDQIFTTSNIKVITCYKEFFNFNNFTSNYGEIICLSVFVIQLIMFFIYLCIGTKPLEKEVDKFFAPKNSNNVNNQNLGLNSLPQNNMIFTNTRGTVQTKGNSALSALSVDQLNNCSSQDGVKRIKFKNDNVKKDKKKTEKFTQKKKNNNNINVNEDKINKQNMETIHSNNSSFQSKESNVDEENNNNNTQRNNNDNNNQNLKEKNNNQNNNINNKNQDHNIIVNDNQNKNINNNNQNNNKNNDQNFGKRKTIASLLGMINEELNGLSFNEAKVQDKRNCCTYYWQILQVSHLFLFTFCHPGDYNLFIVKFGLLLFSVPLNLTIGALFYTTKDMQIVYLNPSTLIRFDLKILARTILTSIISSIILICLKFLCITHGSIQSLRKIENLDQAKIKSVRVINCIKFRVCLYYILSLIFLLMFLYYVKCFSAIYPNNKACILRDMLISWILTILYPFGLVIFTSIFRICSLRFDKYCCFFINKILQMI